MHLFSPTHPLTLVGFVLLLLFSIHRQLIKSGIVPPISKPQAPTIVKLLLTYGFAVAIVVILAGFGLQAYQSNVEAVAIAGPKEIGQETQGPGSPTVADTDGDVTITVEQPPSSNASQ